METAWGILACRRPACLLLTLGLFASCWVSHATGLGCSQNQYQEEGRCCLKCPAGTHMQARCSSNQDTLCHPCLEGTEYNPEWNTKFKCESCRECMNQFIYRRRCNQTANSQCSCVAGMKCWDEGCTRCIPDLPRATEREQRTRPTGTEKEQRTQPTATEKEHTWPIQKSQQPPSSQNELVILMVVVLSVAFLITCVSILHRRLGPKVKAGTAGLCAGSGFPDETPFPKMLQAQEDASLCPCSEEEEGNVPVQEEYRKPEWGLEL